MEWAEDRKEIEEERNGRVWWCGEGSGGIRGRGEEARKWL